MKTKWTYTHDGHGGISVETNDDGRYQICVVRHANEANAKLIAAAPELYEALKELLAAELSMIPPFEAGKEAQDEWADRRAEARNKAGALLVRLN